MDINTLKIKAASLQLQHILFFSYMAYKAKKLRIVSTSQDLWTWLYVMAVRQRHVILLHYLYTTMDF